VPALFKNVATETNHWVAFKLVGGAKSPRDAVGATMYVTTAGIRQREDIYSGGSYASSSDQRPHFGIGSAVKVDKVEIHWPSGIKEEVLIEAVDRFYTLIEGKGIAK